MILWLRYDDFEIVSSVRHLFESYDLMKLSFRCQDLLVTNGGCRISLQNLTTNREAGLIEAMIMLHCSFICSSYEFWNNHKYLSHSILYRISLRLTVSRATNMSSKYVNVNVLRVPYTTLSPLLLLSLYSSSCIHSPIVIYFDTTLYSDRNKRFKGTYPHRRSPHCTSERKTIHHPQRHRSCAS
jgi:hypothetical protein